MYYGIITEGKFCLFATRDASHEESHTRYAKYKGIPDMRIYGSVIALYSRHRVLHLIPDLRTQGVLLWLSSVKWPDLRTGWHNCGGGEILLESLGDMEKVRTFVAVVWE